MRDDATIVIVGAGQAGGWAAQTLRKEGFAAGRPGRRRAPSPHERPPLSKAVLAGEALPESTRLEKPEAFEALGMDWRPTCTGHAHRSRRKRLHLAAGEPIAYDKLILCNGGRARTLSVPGADLPGCSPLRNIDDRVALVHCPSAGNRSSSSAAAGSGSKWQRPPARRACIDRRRGNDRLCERTVPPEISDYLLGLHRSHGTQVILGAGVAVRTHADGMPVSRSTTAGVRLRRCGRRRRPGAERRAGARSGPGVRWRRAGRRAVPHLGRRTSSPPATSRVALRSGPADGMRLESWQNAQEQGIAAARSALGIEVDHQPLPWFWSDQYDINLQIYGMPDAFASRRRAR